MNTDSEGQYLSRLEEENIELRKQNKKLVALVKEIHTTFNAKEATGEWIKSHLRWIIIDLAKITGTKIVSWYCVRDGVEVPKGERCKYCGKTKREKS